MSRYTLELELRGQIVEIECGVEGADPSVGIMLRDRLATAEQHIRLLIPFAQHAEYPEGDPPQVGRAENFLRCNPRDID